MTKREQLARAVLNVGNSGLERPCFQTEICKFLPCACADGIVDAFLAELREPDEEMLNAAGFGAGTTAKLEALDCWQAMIDAIE